jgi:hypothetical protein
VRVCLYIYSVGLCIDIDRYIIYTNHPHPPPYTPSFPPNQQKNNKNQKPGHSLGGALGVLCVLDLLHLGYPVQASITFGQPRVGNRAVRNIEGEEEESVGRCCVVFVCGWVGLRGEDNSVGGVGVWFMVLSKNICMTARVGGGVLYHAAHLP